MEIELVLNGKKKKFRSKAITFKAFRKGTELLPKFHNDEFLGNGYSMEELDESVDLVVDYFNNQFTKEEFHEGFMMEDALDYMALFQQVLLNIQMNNQKREIINSAGKKQPQKQA